MASPPVDTLRSLSEEIGRYSLPYGALGFASNVLTYYTILCLWFGRKPLWPSSRVAHLWLDLALGTIGFMIPTVLSIITIVRCRGNWELLAIGVWKMTMSLLHAIAVVHAPCTVILDMRRTQQLATEPEEPKDGDSESEDGHEPEKAVGQEHGSWSGAGEGPEGSAKLTASLLEWVSWWDILYIPGMCAGVVGLMALVAKDKRHPGVVDLTAGYYAVAGATGLAVVAGVLYHLRRAKDRATAQRLIVGGLIWMVGTFNILRIFYSDWVLGMMSDNVAGLPRGDAKAISWLYLISERLPVFSL